MARTLTPAEKLSRRFERIQREDEQWRIRKARSAQLRTAVASMALRWSSTKASARAAAMSHNGTWAGKPAEHYRRAEERQHLAMLRLLYALEDHANTRYPKAA